MRCLRTTLKISWRDYIPNEIILERSNMLNIEDLVQNRRLRWLGHVSRMQEDRLPHKIVFSELKSGQRARCKPKRRWTDVVKQDMKLLGINTITWRETASNREEWRRVVRGLIDSNHNKKVEKAKNTREERHIIEENFEWNCPLCSFKRQGRQGRQYVMSHITQKHPISEPVNTSLDPLACRHCQTTTKSKAGMTSHMRHKHPDIPQDNSRKPIKTPLLPASSTITSTQETSSSISPQSNSSDPTPSPTNPDNLTCPACSRKCQNRAGLKAHMRNKICSRQLESGIIGYDGRR